MAGTYQRLDVEKAKVLRAQGLSYAEMATILGVHRDTVRKYPGAKEWPVGERQAKLDIQTLKQEVQAAPPTRHTHEWKRQMANEIGGIIEKLIGKFDRDIEKLPITQASVALGILIDKKSQLEGDPTATVVHASVNLRPDDLARRIRGSNSTQVIDVQHSQVS
jgi:hypothetical protein